MSSLQQAIANAMLDIRSLGQDKKHQQGWKYASASLIKKKLRPILGKHGLVLKQIELLSYKQEQFYGKDKTSSGWNLTGDFQIVIGHSESEEINTYKMSGFVTDYSDKVFNKLYTQILKNFLIMIFLLDDGEDDEFDSPNTNNKNSNSNESLYFTDFEKMMLKINENELNPDKILSDEDAKNILKSAGFSGFHQDKSYLLYKELKKYIDNPDIEK